MSGGLLSKAYGSAVTLWHLRRDRGVPYLPRERLCELRDRRVREVVRYAAHTVPYYRDLFPRLGINPADIRTAEDLDCLPLLDKVRVQREPELFLSESKWGRTALPFLTTGSTGMPLTFFRDRHALLVRTVYDMRQRRVAVHFLGRSPTRRGMVVGYGSPASDAVRDFARQNRFRRRRYLDVKILSVMEPVNDIIAAINEYRPDFISTTGSYLELLFRTAAARAPEMHRPCVVFYSGDGISESARRLVEDDFNVPVLSNYGAIETDQIAFLCEQHTHFHLHADRTYVKIVDAHGNRLPDGNLGEVVVSNLINRGTVLLNYRLGDLAALSGEHCPCGRTLPLLTDLQGRAEDILHKRDGNTVDPAVIDIAVHRHVQSPRSAILQYQLIQHDLDAFELRLATADRATFEAVYPDVISDLQAVLGATALVEPVYYEDRLPAEPIGKFRLVLCLLERRESP